MGKCPSGYSLHRIDNAGHYSCGHCEECLTNGWPLNCKWGTRLEQANETSRNRRLTFQGKTLTVAEWARELGVQAPWIYTRLYRGWTSDEVLAFFSVDARIIAPNVTPA
jgi:hypothetical protein